MFGYVWLIVEAHGPWLWVTQNFPKIVRIVCRYGLSHHLEPPNPVSSAHCAILRNCVSRISDLGDLLIVFVALRVAERTSQSVAECQDIERCPQLSELKVKSSERATKQWLQVGDLRNIYKMLAVLSECNSSNQTGLQKSKGHSTVSQLILFGSFANQRWFRNCMISNVLRTVWARRRTMRSARMQSRCHGPRSHSLHITPIFAFFRIFARHIFVALQQVRTKHTVIYCNMMWHAWHCTCISREFHIHPQHSFLKSYWSYLPPNMTQLQLCLC